MNTYTKILDTYYYFFVLSLLINNHVITNLRSLNFIYCVKSLISIIHIAILGAGWLAYEIRQLSHANAVI